jgi:DNA-binding NarL/FixJ family response regulator
MTALDLTPRELSVIELLREGKPNKLIATALLMQESTVKVHVRNIMKKLHVSNRTHAASVANRLLSQPSPIVAAPAF